MFAGFLSAFLIELLGRLEPDPMDIIQDVLIYQTQMMRNSSLEPYVPADFSPPEHIVVVNALFYASLGVMILAAFIAMLIKSWVREFDRGLGAISIPEQRAKTREFRYLGMERWKLSEMVGMLPLLIQISLLLFSVGLMLFLFHISKPSFGVTTAIFGFGVLYYTITTSISVFVTSSPFHSPLSRTLGKAYQHVHAYFCPSIKYFLSETMDTTPETALGRVRRNIRVILQKLRPYVEKGFVEPITTITMDEVQLFTAASALQRIHDSAPNSQHSEALQSSVWQVAGGAAHRIPPLFNLPSWIIDRVDDEEYFSHLPPATLAALVATSLRARDTRDMRKIARARAILRRVKKSDDPWAHVVIEVSKLVLLHIKVWNYHHLGTMRLNLLKAIMGTGFHREASLWLLRTLSELWCSTWLSNVEPLFIDICLPMLMNHATEWGHGGTPDIVLLEAVVTFAAISCSRDDGYQLNILPSIRDHPWLLQNIRNTDIISTLYEGTHPDDHKRLTSMLFLIVYALINRQSYALAIQYSTIIAAERDLSLYASALTTIAPVMTDFGLYAISRMLVARQPQKLHVPCFDDEYPSDLVHMYHDYDERFGTSENLDPNLFAVLLMFSKQTPARWGIQPWHVKLKNPWLRLVAGAVAQLEIPDGPGFPMGLFYHHRLHNMIAAMFLLRYQQGIVPGCTVSLLASLMQSRELPVSSVALKSYMVATISHCDSPAPSCYLSAAVSAVFNVMLPEKQFMKGWEILGIFVDGFDSFSIEWRRTFTEGFFTLARRPQPRPQGEMESRIEEDELGAIITWEYFHKEEIDSGLTDTHFSGLDWMAMAWSHHLSQQPGRKAAGSRQGDPQFPECIGPEVNEEFVFRVLCKLLDAASYHQIVSNIPKLREFHQWFDDTKLTEYRNTISALIEEVIRRHEAFHKFYCSFRM